MPAPVAFELAVVVVAFLAAVSVWLLFAVPVALTDGPVLVALPGIAPVVALEVMLPVVVVALPVVVAVALPLSVSLAAAVVVMPLKEGGISASSGDTGGDGGRPYRSRNSSCCCSITPVEKLGPM